MAEQQRPQQVSQQEQQNAGHETCEQRAQQMFIDKHVDEIRNAEQRIRKDIELKKEELRQMVGERYRDLIDAADTIIKMASSTAEVMSSVDNMHKLCTQLQNGTSSREFNPKTAEESLQNTTFLGVAVELKLLMDTPEQVWGVLERGNYYTATHLFLLARATYFKLKTDTNPTTSRLLSSFPLLSQQWTTIRQFKPVILDGAKSLLGQSGESVTSIVGALATIVLLSDSSIEEALKVFLEIRLESVVSLVKQEMSATTKQQLEDMIKMIVSTIREVHAVFSNGNDDTDGVVDESFSGELKISSAHSLLGKFLHNITQKPTTEEAREERETWIEEACLTGSRAVGQAAPEFVRDFVPEIKVSLQDMSPPDLQAAVSKWVQQAADGTSLAVSKILRYIPSVPGLADLRDDIWRLLKEDCSNNREEDPPPIATSSPVRRALTPTHRFSPKPPGHQQQRQPRISTPTSSPIRRGVGLPLLSSAIVHERGRQAWDKVCSACYGSELSIWGIFLRACFLQRAQGLLTGMLRESLSRSRTEILQLSESLRAQPRYTGNDRDINALIWKEGRIDRSSGLAGPLPELDMTKGAHGLKKKSSGSKARHNFLSQIAEGLTPAVVAVVDGIEKDLEQVYNDANYFMDAPLIDGPSPTDNDNEREDDLSALHGLRRSKSFTGSCAQPFDRNGDADETRRFLQATCESTLVALADSLTEQHGKLCAIAERKEGGLREDGEACTQDDAVDALMFINRVSTAITKHCEWIPRLVLLPTTSSKNFRGGDLNPSGISFSRVVADRLKSSKRHTSNQAVSEDNARLNAINKRFSDVAASCESTWADHVARQYSAEFRNKLLHRDWSDTGVGSLERVWQDHTISEEGEGGTKVDSTIRLPSQACGYVVAFLCDLASEASRAGGHTIRPATIRQLETSVYTAVCDAYAHLLDNAATHSTDSPPLVVICQNGAVQLLFDMYLLTDVLCSPDQSSTAQALIRRIKGMIDPFDLDVFKPFLDQARSRSYQRCSSLLGQLTFLQPVTSAGARSSSLSSSSESHNMLALAPIAARFPMLPVGSSRKPLLPTDIHRAGDHRLDQSDQADKSIYSSLFKIPANTTATATVETS